MTAHQRELLDRYFEKALALPPEQRTAWLGEHCTDSEVRAELESLVPFTTGPPPSNVMEVIGQTAASLVSAELIGQRVGPYRLTGQIGQGGMGDVYRAVRDDDEYEQTVAIKILRFARVDSTALRLFRRERQILAALEHPQIARLLDGGAWVPPGSSESQPYIVMEYVDGLRIDTWCDEHSLDVGNRLALFRQVCECVQHAHQHLILHLDLKPANILVTREGRVKLLDFGIAKLLASEPMTSADEETRTFLQILTPEYASPEQARGERVTTISDVYALGILLYELLTGRRPYHPRDRSLHEIVRVMCEQAPMQPSTALQNDRADGSVSAEVLSACRGATPAQLRKQLQGDLDSIVLKALQKEPARRYASVKHLHDDVRNHQSGLQVTAHPDTLLYRATKFVQQHRGAVALVFLVIASLGIGLLTTFWQLQIFRRELRAAEAQLSLTATKRLPTIDVYTPEIVLFTYTTLMFYCVTGWLTRAGPRRLAGALGGGACFSMVMLGTDQVADSMRWWRYTFPAESEWEWIYLASALYGSALCLLGWRSTRRFGWKGQATFLATMAVCGVAKKFSGTVVSQIIVFHLAFAPLAGTAISWISAFGLAQGMMRITSGPARSDRLARSR